jgi:ADP-ribosyl-[dinitrogen reductase] hydrolase
MKRDSILGCIVGGAIGDAVCSHFEGSKVLSNESIDLTSFDWQITDDTQLTLATCEALVKWEPDPGKIADGLLLWFRARRIRRLGASTLKALRDLDLGCHWALAGRKGEFAAGNGSAIRVAPIAFCAQVDTMVGRQFLRDVSRITHQSDEAYAGALATVLSIFFTAKRNDGSLISDVALELPDSKVKDRLLLLDQEAKMSIVDVAKEFGASGHVADSVPLAIFASQQAKKIGFVNMLQQIVRGGGDCDSIASIASQIVGSSLGLAGLPENFIRNLPEIELILKIAGRFADKYSVTETA